MSYRVNVVALDPRAYRTKVGIRQFGAVAAGVLLGVGAFVGGRDDGNPSSGATDSGSKRNVRGLSQEDKQKAPSSSGSAAPT